MQLERISIIYNWTQPSPSPAHRVCVCVCDSATPPLRQPSLCCPPYARSRHLLSISFNGKKQRRLSEICQFARAESMRHGWTWTGDSGRGLCAMELFTRNLDMRMQPGGTGLSNPSPSTTATCPWLKVKTEGLALSAQVQWIWQKKWKKAAAQAEESERERREREGRV